MPPRPSPSRPMPATGKEFAGKLVSYAGKPAGLHRLRQLRTDVCPAKTKALDMKSLASQSAEEKDWEYAISLPDFKGEVNKKHC